MYKSTHSESWNREWCPHCGTTNFVCQGNLEDVTGTDVEGCICHKCGKKFWLFDPSDMYEDQLAENEGDYKNYDEVLEQVAHCVKGRVLYTAVDGEYKPL